MGLWGNINGFLGYLFHIRGNLEKARRYYGIGMEKDMTNPSFKLAYGVALLKSGEFEKARDVFRDVLLNRGYKESTRNMAKINLSLAYWKLGRLTLLLRCSANFIEDKGIPGFMLLWDIYL